jgi:hypothetical protein
MEKSNVAKENSGSDDRHGGGDDEQAHPSLLIHY